MFSNKPSSATAVTTAVKDAPGPKPAPRRLLWRRGRFERQGLWSQPSPLGVDDRVRFPAAFLGDAACQAKRTRCPAVSCACSSAVRWGMGRRECQQEGLGRLEIRGLHAGRERSEDEREAVGRLAQATLAMLLRT